MIKTNAVRALDRLGIRYELREYEVDPDDLCAGTVAAKTGIPPRAALQDSCGAGRPQWNLFSSNARDRRAGLPGTRTSNRGSEGRHGSF
jgi:hypothetical protein